MKFVVASYGTRGDIEPCAAVGLELQRRGHDVCLAVPPNLIGFVETAGLSAVAYGSRDSQEQLDEQFLHNAWKLQNPIKLLREAMAPVTEGWAELSAMLTPVAAGADLLLTGQIYQEVVANVAEHHGIPLAALHFYPVRANGEIAFPARLPAPLVRSTITAIDWLYWRMTKGVEDAQRRELGLPKASTPAPRRMAVRGSLEIQAYDALCFPGLAAEWGGRRPFVGALTMESATDADDEVASWIAADTPPIYFGFGSMPIGSLADRVAMISAACAELGERALICSGPSDATGIPQFDHVKVVRVVSHAAVFSHLPCGRPPWRRGHHRRRSSSRYPHLDSVGHLRPADLGCSDQTAESRPGETLFKRHQRIADCRPSNDTCAGLCHPSAGDRVSDDQTRRQRHGHRRSARRCSPPCALSEGGASANGLRREDDRCTLRLCP